jgi:hypothetical protein
VRVLGINAVFHDPAAALVVDGVVAWRREGHPVGQGLRVLQAA